MHFKSVFHNYDIRGEFGDQLTLDMAEKIAKSYALYSKSKKVAVGMDCRPSSPQIKDRLVAGLVAMGLDVIDIGMVSTDTLYFTSWYYKLDGGIMITASHMPTQYNGFKFLRLNENNMLIPIGRGVGMEELEEIYNNGIWTDSEKKGRVEQKNVWDDFIKFMKGFVDMTAIKDYKVVMDAGNGMGGVVAEKLFVNTNLKIIKMYFEPDGTFPNHEANPLVEENRRDIIAKVKETKADLGIAWDADCDRVYFIDENGEFVNGDFIVALLAINFLEKKPGSGIVYDLRCTKAVNDWVKKLGGKAYIERVGHSYIKKRMLDTGSIFGGELSGHYYFADNAYMDNGFVPALIILEIMSKTNKKLSELIKELGDYYTSGEINFSVKSVTEVLNKLKDKYSLEAEVSNLDGLTFAFKDWRFNVRPSANDPVLRLNLEANSYELKNNKIKEISSTIKKD